MDGTSSLFFAVSLTEVRSDGRKQQKQFEVRLQGDQFDFRQALGNHKGPLGQLPPIRSTTKGPSEQRYSQPTGGRKGALLTIANPPHTHVDLVHLHPILLHYRATHPLFGKIVDYQIKRTNAHINNTACTILAPRFPRWITKEYWVEPAHSSIVRFESRVDGRDSIRQDIQFDTVDGEWIPVAWRTVCVNSETGAHRLTADCRVTSFQLNAPIAASDLRIDERLVNTAQHSIADIVDGRRVPTPVVTERPLRWWIAGAVASAVVLIVALLRLKQGRST